MLIFHRSMFSTLKVCVLVFSRNDRIFKLGKLTDSKQLCHGIWLVGWLFGFKSPLRQYFSLYRAVSQREGVGVGKG